MLKQLIKETEAEIALEEMKKQVENGVEIIIGDHTLYFSDGREAFAVVNEDTRHTRYFGSDFVGAITHMMAVL